jgi:hypothetical protein
MRLAPNSATLERIPMMLFFRSLISTASRQPGKRGYHPAQRARREHAQGRSQNCLANQRRAPEIEALL